MRDGFIKVAAGTPRIRVADCEYNAEQIIGLMREAAKQGVKVLALPELCVTGYTCGDLFLQDTLLQGAENALSRILEETKDLNMLAALGLPVRNRWDGKLRSGDVRRRAAGFGPQDPHPQLRGVLRGPLVYLWG